MSACSSIWFRVTGEQLVAESGTRTITLGEPKPVTEKQCENRATLRRIWPGSPLDFVCPDHARGWLNIAKAMGVNMFLEPIFETDRKCCNMVKSVEAAAE